MTSWKTLFTAQHLLEAAGALALGLWSVYKKELQDCFKDWSKRAYAHVFQRHIALTLTQTQLKAVLGAGLEGLETYLLLLLKEYQADRVTVTAYESSAGGVLATCMVEVRVAEMRRVSQQYQGTLIPEALWHEIQRWHNGPNRAHYVPDARVLDNVLLRDALRSSSVWSAYYQSLANREGECRAVLALSWKQEHLLTDARLAALHLSGSACSTMLLLMDSMKAPSTG